jgi:hypothetical protein
MSSVLGKMLGAALGSALQSVTVELVASIDAYRTVTYGAPVAYSAWVLLHTKEVRTLQGEQRVSSVEVVFDSGAAEPPAITPRSRITLPDGSQPVILRVDATLDHLGSRQVVVYA